MDPTDRAAENLPLALHYARHHYLGALSFDDAVSACYEGLVEAARRFRPSLGWKFSTYAQFWMRQRLRDARIRAALIRTPHYLHDARARKSPPCVVAAGRVRSVLSGWQGEDWTPLDVLEARHYDPFDDRGTAEAATLLDVLDARERDVIERHFGLGGRPRETLREIGDSLGYTHEGVRQLQKRALAKMRRVAVA